MNERLPDFARPLGLAQPTSAAAFRTAVGMDLVLLVTESATCCLVIAPNASPRRGASHPLTTSAMVIPGRHVRPMISNTTSLGGRS